MMKKITNDWIIRIPFLLDEAVREYKKSTEVSLTKSTTQGWSIVVASLFDVYSDYSFQKNSLKKDPENGFRYLYSLYSRSAFFQTFFDSIARRRDKLET